MDIHEVNWSQEKPWGNEQKKKEAKLSGHWQCITHTHNTHQTQCIHGLFVMFAMLKKCQLPNGKCALRCE